MDTDDELKILIFGWFRDFLQEKFIDLSYFKDGNKLIQILNSISEIAIPEGNDIGHNFEQIENFLNEEYRLNTNKFVDYEQFLINPEEEQMINLLLLVMGVLFNHNKQPENLSCKEQNMCSFILQPLINYFANGSPLTENSLRDTIVRFNNKEFTEEPSIHIYSPYSSATEFIANCTENDDQRVLGSDEENSLFMQSLASETSFQHNRNKADKLHKRHLSGKNRRYISPFVRKNLNSPKQEIRKNDLRKIRLLESEINNLNKLLEASQEECNQLREYTLLRDDEIVKMKKHLESTKAYSMKLKNEHNDYHDEILSLTQRNKELEKVNNKNNTERDKLIQVNNQLKDKLRNIEENLKDYKSKCRNLEENMDLFSKRLLEKETLCKTLQNQESLERLAKVEVETEKSLLQNEIFELQKQLRQFELCRANQDSLLSDSVLLGEASLEGGENMKLILETKLKETEKELKEERKGSICLKHSVTEYENRFDELQTELEKMSLENRELKRKINDVNQIRIEDSQEKDEEKRVSTVSNIDELLFLLKTLAESCSWSDKDKLNIQKQCDAILNCPRTVVDSRQQSNNSKHDMCKKELLEMKSQYEKIMQEKCELEETNLAISVKLAHYENYGEMMSTWYDNMLNLRNKWDTEKFQMQRTITDIFRENGKLQVDINEANMSLEKLYSIYSTTKARLDDALVLLIKFVRRNKEIEEIDTLLISSVDRCCQTEPIMSNNSTLQVTTNDSVSVEGTRSFVDKESVIKADKVMGRKRMNIGVKSGANHSRRNPELFGKGIQSHFGIPTTYKTRNKSKSLLNRSNTYSNTVDYWVQKTAERHKFWNESTNLDEVYGMSTPKPRKSTKSNIFEAGFEIPQKERHDEDIRKTNNPSTPTVKSFRLDEFRERNQAVPAHLKSSYPIEIQQLRSNYTANYLCERTSIPLSDDDSEAIGDSAAVPPRSSRFCKTDADLLNLRPNLSKKNGYGIVEDKGYEILDAYLKGSNCIINDHDKQILSSRSTNSNPANVQVEPISARNSNLIRQSQNSDKKDNQDLLFKHFTGKENNVENEKSNKLSSKYMYIQNTPKKHIKISQRKRKK